MRQEKRIENRVEIPFIDWTTTLNFSDGKLNDGLDFLKANHLFNIKATQAKDKPVQVSAHCIPEMKIRESYRIWMEIDEHNKPIAHDCTCPFGSYLCKHKAALVLYAKNHRNETQTDRQCTFLKPSDHSLKLYPRGKQLEQIKKLPEKDCCPNLTFDMIDDDEKRYLAELMEATGVTKSPLFKLVKSRVPTAARSLTSINDELLEKMPVWIKDSVFKETKVEDIPFKVITFYLIEIHTCILVLTYLGVPRWTL